MSASAAGQLPSLATRAGIVTLLNAIALASGLLLYRWLAALFGATETTDAFFLALVIPSLFIGPVLSTAAATLTPVLTECRINHPERVGPIVGSALLWSVIAAAAAAAVIGLLAPAGLEATGRVLSPTLRRLVVVNVVALLPLVVAQTASAILSIASNAAACLWLPPCALIARQVVTIVLAVGLHDRLGVLALPIAFSAGGVAQLAVLLALWRCTATRIQFGWRLRGELAEGLRRGVPLLIGTALLQLAVVVTRFLAAQLPPGSVTALDYATRIYAAVVDVAASGLLLVTLTDWSAVNARGDVAGLQLRVRHTVTLALFALVPVVVALYAGREPLVGLWLGRAGIDPALGAATAMTLGYLVLALPLEITGRIYSQLLVVRRVPWILAAIAAVRGTATVALAAALSGPLGVPGIGAAETLGLLVSAAALAGAAQRLAGHSLTETLVAGARLAMAGVGAWLAAHGAYAVLSGRTNVVLLTAVTATALTAYLGLAWALRAPELRAVIGYAFGRRAVGH